MIERGKNAIGKYTYMIQRRVKQKTKRTHTQAYTCIRMVTEFKNWFEYSNVADANVNDAKQMC